MNSKTRGSFYLYHTIEEEKNDEFLRSLRKNYGVELEVLPKKEVGNIDSSLKNMKVGYSSA